MDKKFVLHPLTLSQVLEDQVQMKAKRENEKKKSPQNAKLFFKIHLRYGRCWKHFMIEDLIKQSLMKFMLG